MRLESLQVFHLPKKMLPAGFEPCAVSNAFYFESCQRHLWISKKEVVNAYDLSLMDIYEGADAYQFLLSVSSGLESVILGETDVFGQLKTAWNAFASASKLKADLSPWMQKLFEDTKELRSRHMQNLGNASYGSLVRKLVARERGPVLLIGAGQLAQSIAPYLLSHSEVWVANRDSGKLDSLFQLLAQQREAHVKRISSELLDDAVATAAQVVICIPVGSTPETLERDARWIESRKTSGHVIHLGVLRVNAGAWVKTATFRCLDDLFELQKSINDLKSIQINQAKKACVERSKLRALGPSISIPHGWEDLATFG